MSLDSNPLFTEGYRIKQTVTSEALDFVDLRKIRPSQYLQVLNQYKKYLKVINHGTNNLRMILADSHRLHGSWSFGEAQQLLVIAQWYLDRPFRQTMNLITDSIFEDPTYRTHGQGATWRGMQLDADFSDFYQTARDAINDITIDLRHYEQLATRSGYTIRRFNQMDILATIDDAPAATAIEMLAGIVRRTAWRYSPTIRDPQALLEYAGRSLLFTQLPSLSVDNTNKQVSDGRPRIIAWAVHIDTRTIAIRSTRPNWNDFAPLFALSNKMRWRMIQDHLQLVADTTADHRTAHLGHEHPDSNQALQKAGRIAATEAWIRAGKGLEVQGIPAGSYNGYSFEFTSRCWACRGMTPFNMYIQEANDEKAWCGRDFCKKNLVEDRVNGRRVYRIKGNSGEERQKNVREMATCAEIWCAVAMLELDARP